MPQSTEQMTSGMALRRRSLVASPLVRLGAVAVLVSLLGGSIWAYFHAQPNTRVIATNGADRWATDHQTTAATIPFTTPETLQIAVDPAFSAYYRAHDGARLLGTPLTPGFASAQGWIQFFTFNALLQPGIHHPPATGQSQRDQQIDRLMRDGWQDHQTGIIQLPLLQALLTAGSRANVGGGLTYIDLRSATNPDQMQPAPERVATNTAQPTSRDVFVRGGTRNSAPVGHIIPAAFWAYITQRDVSPDGWEQDFGAPLTDAIPYVTVQYGVSHRMLMQVFWRGALVMDRDTQDAKGQPLIQLLDTGVAYLQTFTPPAALVAHRSIWTTSDLNILNAPATGKPILRVGPNFMLTLAGDARWNAGTLWYQVQWKHQNVTGSGWVPANELTFVAPARPSNAASAPASSSAAGGSATFASFDQLSTNLALYLESQSSTTGAAVYDLTRQKYYTYQPNNQYLMGDAIKLPFLLAFLAMKEQQGIRPTSNEMTILQAMMSSPDVNPADDDTAENQMYNEIGRAPGLKAYLTRLGIVGMEPENDDWTYSMTRPLAMVQLLTLLYEGKVLTPQDHALALSLLARSTPDQQVGVGDTRPQGAAVTAQDGWVMGTDNHWAMNSAGIVTVGGKTYIIAVYSAHLNSLAQGQDIARQVCGRVAALLG